MPRNDLIQIRKGTTSQWATADTASTSDPERLLGEGEPGLDTTLDIFKIGDGVTKWADLPFANQSILNTSYDARTVNDVRDFGGASDNSTDNTSAFSTGQQAGKVLRVPTGLAKVAGSSGIGILLKTSEHIRGDGKYATTLKGTPSGVDPLNALLSSLSSGYTSEVEISDMTFDLARCLNGLALAQGFAGRLRFKDTRWLNVPKDTYAVNTGFAYEFLFEDFECRNGGGALGTFFAATNKDLERAIFRRGKLTGLANGFLLGTDDGSRVGRVDIDDVDIDLLWYLTAAERSSSGGAVSYSSTVLTDTNANFTTIVGTSTTVRVMPTRRGGAACTAGTQGTILFDTGGSFITSAGVQRGDIIRTATAWAVVSKVESETCLHVEGWFDLVTYQPAQAPTTGTVYSIFAVWLGTVASKTATTLTVDHWFDSTGAALTPPAGTRYEVLVPHPNYPIKAAQTVEDLRLTNVEVMRGWADQVSINCERYQLNGVRTVDGQDMGLTLEGGGKGTVANYVGRHNGTCGIIVTADHSDVELLAPLLEDNTWTLTGTGVPQLSISAPRVRLRGGQALRSGAGRSRIGLGFDGAGTIGCVAEGFSAHGHPDGDIWIDSNVPAGANLISTRDVDTIVYAGAATTKNGQRLEIECTGVPAVLASPSSIARRKDGGAGSSLYVKETAATSTTWAAK